jgi:hypothetical protein
VIGVEPNLLPVLIDDLDQGIVGECHAVDRILDLLEGAPHLDRLVVGEDDLGPDFAGR